MDTMRELLNGTGGSPFRSYWDRMMNFQPRGIAAVGDVDYSHEPNTVACYHKDHPEHVVVRTVGEIRGSGRSYKSKHTEAKGSNLAQSDLAVMANVIGTWDLTND
jgi:hypothetical protein